MTKPRRIGRWLAGLALVLALAGVGALVFAHRDRLAAAAPKPVASHEAKVVPVTVEPATPRSVRRTISLVGSLYGWEEIHVTSKVDGRVLAIHHDVGDVVRPGDLLFEIDPVDYQLAADEMKKALDLELAKLGLRELPPEGFDVATLPAVVRAMAQEQNAQARKERLRQIGGRGVAGEDRDQAEMDHAVARANLQQSRLDSEATLAAARHRHAAWQTALQRLRDTKVVVPDGTLARIKTPGASPGALEFVVAQRTIAEGEMTRSPGLPGSSAPAFMLVIDRPLKLKATLPERHRAEVQLGQDVAVAVEAYPGRAFAGKVSRIAPAVDRASRTFEVEIELPNEGRELAAGSFARASIFVRDDADALTVPEEALVQFAGVAKVFAVRAGVAHEVPVVVGAVLEVPDNGRKRLWLEVQGDLRAGDAVITTGYAQLADGMPVRVKNR